MILDYTYQFDKKYMATVNISLSKAGFCWTKPSELYDTVFLKLKIKPMRKSLVLPYLEVSTEKERCKQYLERGNEGARYFNLTSLVRSISVGDNIFLKSSHLKWENTAELIFFNNEIKKDEKILAISPHPDDAELAAFGFYKNHDSTVVTLTAGEGGKNYFYEFCKNNAILQSELKAKLRVFDSRCIPFFGNVPFKKTINLGYFDDTLEEMYRQNDKSARSLSAGAADVFQFRSYDASEWELPSDGQATWNNLIQDLKNIISQLKPSAIVLPHPTLDKNKDHQYTAKAVFEALSFLKEQKGTFLFYVNHSVLSERYPYGPINSPITLPPNFNHFETPCSIFSYPLTDSDQMNKTFALDAMHDLREIPFCKKGISEWFKRRFSKKYKHYYSFQDSYRKAIRSNELFIVVPLNQIGKLHEAV